MSKEWFYVNEGAQVGPLDADEMHHLIRNGDIRADTLVWSEGMNDWEPARLHFETQRRYATPTVPRGGSVPAQPWDGPAQPRTTAQTTPDGLYVGAPARGFVEAVKVCLSRYFTFSGRASRSEYWFFVLFGIVAGIVATIIDSAFFGLANDWQPLSSLTTLALFIPSLAVGFRRMHDIGRTGLWVLSIYVAPILFAFAAVFFVMSFAVVGPGSTMGPSGAPMVLIGGFAVLWLGLGLVTLVFLCTRGDPGPNRYG